MAILDEASVRQGLESLDGWTLEQQSIVRTLEFASFADAMAFVNRVAELAEEADHHPDIDIRYRKVRLELSTHSAGGLTRRDFELARKIDALD